MTDDGFGSREREGERLGEIKRCTDIRWRMEGTEIGVVDARAMVKEEGGGSRRRQEGEFVDLAGNGGGCSFSWRAKAEVGVDAFLPR